MFGAWLRRTVYWTLDAIKGGKIKAHRKDIRAKLAGEKGIDDSLNEILKYVKQNVPYYQEKDYLSLSDFPVINKKIIMENYDSFRSVEYLDNEKLHEVATSGSSGNPFHAYQDANKRRRVIADLTEIHEKLGWKIGERYVFLRAWTGNYNNMRIQQLKQNFIAVDVIDFDRVAMDRLRKTLKKDKNIRTILGYSSSLMDLARYMLDQGDSAEDFSVQLILADSDNLSPEGKANLEKVFGCPVVSRYDNEEQGILAYSLPYEDEFVINTPSLYVEILAMDADVPAKPGETGRVVVTDMYNKAMAFIRYDTGDLAIAGEQDGNRCLTIRSLQGRTSDVIFTMDGNAVYSPTINNFICDFYSIKKYQLIQEAAGVFQLLIVCAEEGVALDEVDASMRRILGQDVQLTIRVVDNIPVGKNGKFKTVVNRVH